MNSANFGNISSGEYNLFTINKVPTIFCCIRHCPIKHHMPFNHNWLHPMSYPTKYHNAIARYRHTVYTQLLMTLYNLLNLTHHNPDCELSDVRDIHLPKNRLQILSKSTCTQGILCMKKYVCPEIDHILDL